MDVILAASVQVVNRPFAGAPVLRSGADSRVANAHTDETLHFTDFSLPQPSTCELPLKHVWIVNHYAQIPTGTGGTRHYSIARELIRCGWTATIFASSVELNTNRQRLAEGETHRVDETAAGKFYWIRSPEYSGNGIGRMLNMFHFSLRLLTVPKVGVVPNPDVIVGSSVHPFAAFAAMILAFIRRTPFIFEVRDLWPQTLIDLGRIKPMSPLAILLRLMERIMYRRSSLIITLLPDAWKYIEHFGVQREKIRYVPNGADLEIFSEPADSGKDKEPFCLMYFGSFGNANGIDQLIEGMAEVRVADPNGRIVLDLIGEGPLKAHYQHQAESLGLSQVRFQPGVPRSAIPKIAAEADAFVVCLPDIPLYKFGISLNKLYDYMAAGRPIIFAGNPSNNPVSESGSGISISPGDPVAFRDAVLSIVQMPAAQRAELGRKGRDFVRANFSFEMIAKRFAAVLDNALKHDT